MNSTTWLALVQYLPVSNAANEIFNRNSESCNVKIINNFSLVKLGIELHGGPVVQETPLMTRIYNIKSFVSHDSLAPRDRI